MQSRRLGKTGHMSSIIAIGGAALGTVTQAEADKGMNLAMEHHINHIDVAPSYGEAELRIGPWTARYRNEFFLGCKTQARDKKTAWESIKRSLDRLKTGYFDLYQFHGVDDLETLYAILSPGGALEAVLEARTQGLIRNIGITGHRPFVYLEVLNRFDFDTVLFPLSRVHAGHINDQNNFLPLLEYASRKDVGILAIKAVSKRAWPDSNRAYHTWYEPFDDQTNIDRSLWYTLSMDVDTLPMPSDLSLWPLVISAAERFNSLSPDDQATALADVKQYQPISVPGRN